MTMVNPKMNIIWCLSIQHCRHSALHKPIAQLSIRTSASTGAAAREAPSACGMCGSLAIAQRYNRPSHHREPNCGNALSLS